MSNAAQLVDAIVIGAGQSGPSLAVRLANAGQSVVLIERKGLGGTCVNNGCTPTKTLVASARAAWVARHSAEFGVHTGPVSVDMKAVKARKDAVVAQSVTSLTQWLGSTPNLTLVWGQAQFIGDKQVEANGVRYQAERVFIDVGGRPAMPDWPGLANVPYLTNESMMDLDVLPEHLVIVGGSYIGLEFAQMYARFGAQVTVIESAPRIIAREDEATSIAVADVLQRDGVTIRAGASELSVSGSAGNIQVHFMLGGSSVTVSGSHLLLALGRTPNTDTLNLPAAGIAADARGNIVVDEQLQSSVTGVYALGDCNGRGAFTHTSYNDYEIVAANLLDGGQRKVSERIPVYALYTDPPLARIGISTAQARGLGRPVLIGHLPMARVARARERGETSGFMEVLVDAETRRILGATLLGIEADEVIHVLLMVMAAGEPYTLVNHTMGIHPTVAELLPTLLESLKPLA